MIIVEREIIQLLNDKIDMLQQEIRKIEDKTNKIYEEIHNGYISERVDRRIAEDFGRGFWKILLVIIGSSGILTVVWSFIKHLL